MAKKYKPKKSENIGHRQGNEITITIDDPEFKASGAKATRPASGIINSKGNPIALLYSKGHIDAIQKMAADRFCELWDMINVGCGLGLDPTREIVDGGNYHQGMSATAMQAAKELDTIRNKLGLRGYSLLENVIGKGIAISIIFTDRKARESKTAQLYECLDVLAIHFKYKADNYDNKTIYAKNQNSEKNSHLRKIHPFNA